MHSKVFFFERSNDMKLKKVYLFLILLNLTSLFANVLNHPRKINVISTEFFDIIFPSECTFFADLVSEHADSFYLDACEKLNASEKFRLPIVISPDSDVLSVEYAPSPYNRIVIYSSLPKKDITFYEDDLLSLLNKEIVIMTARTKRDKNLKFIANIVGGDLLQPSYILNAPYSFVEGINFVSDDDKEKPLLKDKYSLQLLAQAKSEKKFPSWFQMSGSRDIYPKNDLSIAAMSGFSAYIQQRWGFSKYIDLWNEFESFHPIKLFKGTFEKNYGISLKQAWADFEESIPLPTDLIDEEELDTISEKMLSFDKDGLYEHLISTPYGFVWFDNLKHEVSLFSDNNLISNTRTFLFFASDVTSLNSSPDGRFLIVSFSRTSNRNNLMEDCILIFDLKRLVFLEESYPLRSACILETNDQFYAIAGINIKDTLAELQIIPSSEINEILADEREIDYSSSKKIIYSKIFNYSQTPYSLCSMNTNELSYLLNSDNKTYFCSFDIQTNKEKIFEVKDSSGNNITLYNLHRSHTHLNSINNENLSEFVYTFQFFDNSDISFIKTGIITIDEDFNPVKVLLQDKNISGGIISLAFDKNSVLFSTRKFEHDELRRISLDNLSFINGNIIKSEEKIIKEPSVIPEFQITNTNNKKITKLNQYFVKKYTVLPYLFHISAIPLISILDYSDEKYVIQPGIGISFVTQNDPLLNNKITFTAKYNFTNPIENIDIISSTNDFDSILYLSYSFAESLTKLFFLTGQKTLSIDIKNKSTPVDIDLNSIVDFYDNGQYQIKINTSTNWAVPLGMTFKHLNLGLKSELRASSIYYDYSTNTSLLFKFNYPSIFESYRTIKLSFNGVFSNIHQYGISPYEKRGFSFGLNIYSLWDFYLIDDNEYQRQEYYVEFLDSPTIESYIDYLTFENDTLDGPSQINLNIFASLQIPQLTPLQNVDNWILSVPATINVNLFRKTGEAFTSNAEILLIGKEIQNGIPALLLYFERAGLILGYNFTLNYNRFLISTPDLRNFESYKNIFTNTVLSDYAYLKLNIDFSPVVGKYSTYKFSANLNFNYYIRTNTFKVNFGFAINK